MTSASGDSRVLRPAQAEDAGLLWAWANDPSVRAWAFHPEPIPWETHVRWYEQRLASADSCIWLLEVGGEPVGQVRYDRDGDGRTAVISFSVARHHRGKAYGLELVQRTRQSAWEHFGVQEIVAIVIAENTPSIRTFIHAGFETQGVTTVRGRPCYRFSWRPVDAKEEPS